jgi:hypothetical protein
MDMTATKITVMMAVAMVLLLSLPLATVTNAQGPGPGGLPDVKIKSITFSSDNPNEGDIITITATVSNNGSKDLTNLIVIFSYDGTNITTVKNVSVAANSTTPVQVTWKAVKWTHDMAVVAGTEKAIYPKSALTMTLKVNANPIGDPWTILGALIAVGITILIAVAFPAILGSMKKKNMK